MVLLCFNREETENMSPKKCYQYGSPSTIFGETSIEHNAIQLGNYKGQPIAVGGWYSRAGEVMSLISESYEWSPIAEFPCGGENCNRFESKMSHNTTDKCTKYFQVNTFTGTHLCQLRTRILSWVEQQH